MAFANVDGVRASEKVQLEQAPTIVHDGSFESCSAVKNWARRNGFDFISSFSEGLDPRSNVVCIGRGRNFIRLRAGDQAYVLNGKLVKDWWRG